MKSKNKFSFGVLIVFIILLIFLRSDYRLIEKPICCGDDHDYFSHAESLVIDFDFDYTNQLDGFENKRFNQNGKIAPKGFIGSGLFAAPFLYIGNLIDKLYSLIHQGNNNNIMNYKILLYSFSPIFYLFGSIELLKKTFTNVGIKINMYLVYLVMFGSGLSYFAFERYSMTHVYEVFGITLIFYISSIYYTKKEINNNLIVFMIPIFVSLTLSIRWTNYFVLLIPILFKWMFENKIVDKALIKEKLFYVSVVISTFLFLFINFKVYGLVTLNPNIIYGDAASKTNIYFNNFDNFAAFTLNLLQDIYRIFFESEFGIFWFSPIIFIGCIYSLFKIILNKKFKFKLKLLIFISFSQVFGTVLIWQSTASSYGFRYLYSLIPLCMIIFFTNTKSTDKYTNFYIIFMSAFAILGITFFETTEDTSLRENINVFGAFEPYSQPEYLFGLLKSFTNLESYLIIISTSFLGAFIFKILLIFINIDGLNSLFLNLGLPVDNQDFQFLLLDLNKISFDKFLFIATLLFFISRKVMDDITKL